MVRENEIPVSRFPLSSEIPSFFVVGGLSVSGAMKRVGVSFQVTAHKIQLKTEET
jgi:hypothetical protein